MEQARQSLSIRLMISMQRRWAVSYGHVLGKFFRQLDDRGSIHSSMIMPTHQCMPADVALISANLSEGAGTGLKLVREIRQRPLPARCIRAAGRLSARAGCWRPSAPAEWAFVGAMSRAKILASVSTGVYHGQIGPIASSCLCAGNAVGGSRIV